MVNIGHLLQRITNALTVPWPFGLAENYSLNKNYYSRGRLNGDIVLGWFRLCQVPPGGRYGLGYRWIVYLRIADHTYEKAPFLCQGLLLLSLHQFEDLIAQFLKIVGVIISPPVLNQGDSSAINQTYRSWAPIARTWIWIPFCRW